MLRRLGIALLLLLGTVAGLRAQSTGGNVGNTVLVRFTGAPSGACLPNQEAINNATTDFYVCNSSNAWVKVGSSGGGGSPGGATGTLQYNAGAGAFGGIPDTLANSADCDGVGDPCFISFTSNSTYYPIFYGTNSMGDPGNYFDFYQFTNGGLFMDTADGNGATSSLGLDGTDGQTFLIGSSGGLASGIAVQTANRLINIGRFQFNTSYLTSAQTTNFTLGAGWGSTAVATAVAGSDSG
jgi:hypothetical protein